MNPIGIMQGRLSPPSDGQIQSFPSNTWRQEFELAAQAELACIEWIYEAGTDHLNPIRSDEGVAEISRLSDTHGVGVRSICADYFMKHRLVARGGELRLEAVENLKWLLGRARQMKIRYIVLPFVDSSSLATDAEIEALSKLLRDLGEEIELAGVEFHLETDLKPTRLLALLESIDHGKILANYDIGNSAALGHDPAEELTLIGSRLGSVHVKDRIRGGHTVALGTGSADFATCFRLLKEIGFAGPFILQAARNSELSEVELATRNRAFVEEQLLALTAA